MRIGKLSCPSSLCLSPASFPPFPLSFASLLCSIFPPSLTFLPPASLFLSLSFPPTSFFEPAYILKYEVKEWRDADMPPLSTVAVEGGVHYAVDPHASKYYAKVIGSHQALTLQ